MVVDYKCLDGRERERFGRLEVGFGEIGFEKMFVVLEASVLSICLAMGCAFYLLRALQISVHPSNAKYPSCDLLPPFRIQRLAID